MKPVDRCIAPIVEALNAAAARDRLPGMRTACSCCGHGKSPGTINLHDGRWLVIAADSHEAWALQDATAELTRVTAERDRMRVALGLCRVIRGLEVARAKKAEAGRDRARAAGRRLANYWRVQADGAEASHEMVMTHWRSVLGTALGLDMPLLSEIVAEIKREREDT